VYDIEVFDVDVPPVKIASTKARLIKLEGMVARREQPACDIDQYPCGSWKFHPPKEEAEVLPLPATVPVEEFDALLAEYHLCQSEESAAAKRKKAAGAEIAAYIEQAGATDRGGVKMRGDAWEVTWRVEVVPDSTEPRKGFTKRYPKVTPTKGTASERAQVRSDSPAANPGVEPEVKPVGGDGQAVRPPFDADEVSVKIRSKGRA
jgi:hypothetical protein